MSFFQSSCLAEIVGPLGLSIRRRLGVAAQFNPRSDVMDAPSLTRVEVEPDHNILQGR
jgi:hypothetical protein